MFRIVPFEAWHLHEFQVQQPNLVMPDWQDQDQRALENGLAYTAIDDRILGCAGLIPIWTGRDHAWAMLGDCGPKHFLRIHREILKMLESLQTRRTEMWVDPGYEQGRRWAEMLGFVKECTMTGFSPAGRDFDLYARVLKAA